jgi:hypothetical protein
MREVGFRQIDGDYKPPDQVQPTANGAPPAKPEETAGSDLDAKADAVLECVRGWSTGGGGRIVHNAGTIFASVARRPGGPGLRTMDELRACLALLVERGNLAVYRGSLDGDIAEVFVRLA